MKREREREGKKPQPEARERERERERERVLGKLSEMRLDSTTSGFPAILVIKSYRI